MLGSFERVLCRMLRKHLGRGVSISEPTVASSTGCIDLLSGRSFVLDHWPPTFQICCVSLTCAAQYLLHLRRVSYYLLLPIRIS